MDMSEELMSDAVDDAMEDEDEGEGEEVESDKILKEVLDEIGMSMNDSVSPNPIFSLMTACFCTNCQPPGQRAPPELQDRRRGGSSSERSNPTSRWKQRRGRPSAPLGHVTSRLIFG